MREVIHIFLGLLLVRYNCAKFRYCRMCVIDFKEEGPFRPHPHPWAASKKSILNRVNIDIFKILFYCFSEKVYAKICIAVFYSYPMF